MRLHTLASLAIAGTVAFAAPASAVVSTFAQFNPISNTANFRWLASANNAGGNFGRNATFYTTATPGGTVSAPRLVNFSFLQPALVPYVTNVNALFKMDGTVTNTIATLLGGDIVQTNIAGSFSFKSTSTIVIGTSVFLAGSNLLSGTYMNTALMGARNGTSAGWSGSTPMSTITYTSDFLTFSPGMDDYDLTFNVNAIGPLLNATGPGNSILVTPNKALRNFRAVIGGQFSSDPAPLTPTIPEPAVWAQLILGFTMVGFAARRRKITVAA